MNNDRFSQAAELLITEFPDLRLRHCDLATLENRKVRSVCVFDMAGWVGRDASDRLIDSSEVKVVGVVTIKDILSQMGMSWWNGHGPQIKLVTQNTIIQSPASVKRDAKAVREFLRLRVSPGDFIVVARYS